MRAHVNSNEAQDERYNGNYSWGLWPLFEQTLTFNRTFDNHSLTLLGGMTMQRYGESRSLSISGTNYPNENLTNILLAQDNLITNEDIGVGSSLSYFGRLNYAFANKYLLTAIVRRDGSDKFAAGNRWGTFPSLSAAWKLHEEDFIQSSLPAVSSLKVRGGWGIVGIDAISKFQYLSLIHSKGMSYPVGVPGGETYLPGSTIKALASPDIKWEEATTTNIGLDLGLFNNQITFTADYVDPRAYYTFYGDAASGGDTTFYYEPEDGDGLANEHTYNYDNPADTVFAEDGSVLNVFPAKGYAYKKYQRYELRTNEGTPRSPINSRYLRYADVLLQQAECHIMNNNNGDALTLINRVRERAGAEKYNDLGSDPMAILKRERRLELGGEQVRFWDLIRWGDLVETLNPEKDAQGEGTPYQEKHSKFPIPTDELDINKEMTNDIYFPGWN